MSTAACLLRAYARTGSGAPRPPRLGTFTGTHNYTVIFTSIPLPDDLRRRAFPDRVYKLIAVLFGTLAIVV